MSTTIHPTLADIHADLWAGLARAVVDRRHAWHLITIATLDAADGPAFPELRTVVLRRADPEQRVLMAHTDRRSAKVAHLAADPRCAVLAYDPKGKQQLRLRCRAEVHTAGPVFERQWQASRLMSRRCYLAPLAPGTPADEPVPNIPEDLRHTEPDQARSELGRENFAVIGCAIERIDWLHLAHDGHRRAAFAYDRADPAAEPVATWLAP